MAKQLVMLAHTLTESVPAVLALSKQQALALNQLGRELASKKPWWGDPLGDEIGEDDERSLIRCRPTIDGSWEVLIANAVGLISTEGLVLHVQPKIPLAHAVFLFEQSEQFPRLSKLLAHAGLSGGTLLWHAMAQWLVGSVEAVLRGDLRKDYRHDEDSLTVARGRIHTYRTVNSFYGGSARVHCEFDEFDEDNALNRLLKAALKALPSIGGLSQEIYQRAKRALLRLSAVGELRPTDLRVNVDRNAIRYSEAVSLSKHVLLGFARTLDAGPHQASCFLLRTPDLIEAGIRNVLKANLKEICSVEKRGLQIAGTSYTLNPDLVFGNVAVGDVKYKVSNAWIRSDLYQAVTFATAFGVQHAIIVQFTHAETASGTLELGGKKVTRLHWTSDPKLIPEFVANSLTKQLTQLLKAN